MQHRRRRHQGRGHQGGEGPSKDRCARGMRRAWGGVKAHSCKGERRVGHDAEERRSQPREESSRAFVAHDLLDTLVVRGVARLNSPLSSETCWQTGRARAQVRRDACTRVHTHGASHACIAVWVRAREHASVFAHLAAHQAGTSRKWRSRQLHSPRRSWSARRAGVGATRRLPPQLVHTLRRGWRQRARHAPPRLSCLARVHSPPRYSQSLRPCARLPLR